MTVIVPTHLRRYPPGLSEVEACGATLREVLLDLEARFSGVRHRVIDEQDRIRPHVKFFVGGDETHALDTAVGDREVQIVAALSGG